MYLQARFVDKRPLRAQSYIYSRWSFNNLYFSATQIDPSIGNQTLADDSTSIRDMYLGVYGGLGFGQAMSVVTGALFLYLATLQGARKLHDNILANVLRLPMSYFDTTPQGRILNR